MVDLAKPPQSQKKKLWRYLPVLAVFGLAVYFLAPQFATLIRSWDVVRNMTLWAVLLVVICEIISWVGNGIVLSAILDIQQQKLPVWKGTLIAVATLSITLAAGGGVALAATYSWIHRENQDGKTAVLAGVFPSFVNNGVLVAVSMIGVAYLLFVRLLTRLQLVEFSLILLILGTFTAVALLLLRSVDTVTRIVDWALGHWARLWHKPYDAERTRTMVAEFVEVWHGLGNGRWLKPLVGALVNVGFDMLALYFMFVASGTFISIGTLFAGYGLPLILGKMAFFFPGGVGVVEGSMVALFRGLHIPQSVGAVVVLGYRLFSIWLPTILGFLAAMYLSGKLFIRKEK